MEHTLKSKDGRKIVLGRKPRDGSGREASWDDKARKLRFKDGGSRRFSNAVAAARWAADRNFKVTS